MPDENIYTVRYYVGPADLETRNYLMYQFLRDLYITYGDLMPMYKLQADEEYLWMYCTFQVPAVMMNLIHSYTNGMVLMCPEQEL